MDFSSRVLADARDRPAWLAAREGKIGGSDAASFAKLESAPLYLRAKLHNPFNGNAYTVHGNDREARMLAHFRIPQNTLLYRSEGNPRHVATPDGIAERSDGEIILAQCKTSEKPIPLADRIPPTYRRQMWWEQYVMGVERTLLVWEQHRGFRPVTPEPQYVWFHRDDTEIAKLIAIADYVLEGLDAAEQFIRDMKGTLR